MTKHAAVAFFVLFALATAIAQTAPGQPAQMPGGMASGDMDQLNSTLLQLQQTARDAESALARMRIDKWKTDSDTKKQGQANADSLQRNLASALPDLIAKVRATPQDLPANFKLYRNLNAVYDVFVSVAESAGAFGPKDQYEPLASQAANLDALRRQLADRVERLSTATQMELARYRAEAERLARQQAQAPPKKIVVDDTEPVKPKKKKPKAAPPTPPTQ